MPGAETEQKTETPAVEEKTPVEQMKEKVAEEGKHCQSTSCINTTNQ